MSSLARARPVWLSVTGVAVLVGLVASGFSPPLLFELIGRDHDRWVERFSSGQEEALVHVQEGTGRIPYILPGPLDAWAGGRPHRIRIHFVGPPRELLLLLLVPDAHEESPPRLAVSMNGREVGQIRVRKGKGLPPPHKGVGPPLEYVLPIPAAALDPARSQILTLANGEGSWVMLSRLQLLSAVPTFSFVNFLDPSPPPRWALIALGVGLLGLWAADRRRLRARASSSLLLVAGLGLLAFLGIALDSLIAGWHVILVTHRATWLLAALGFVVSLAPRLPRPPLPYLLYLTAFATGAIVMVLELVGFRLLSPFFGYSIYVWGSLLGVIMGALAIGYYLGGWLADRWSRPAVLYQGLLATGLLILAAYFAYPFIIRLTVNLPLISGSLLATLLLLFLPMVGLSLAPPFIIRAMAASGSVGLTAGRIYATSTVGSIVGTFASAFFLITALGPQESWVAAGVVVFLLAIYGLSQDRGQGAVVAALSLGLILVVSQPWVPELSVASLKGGTRLYEVESDYSHLEVIEVGTTLHLVPQLHFVHTIYDEERVFEPITVHGLLPSFLTHPRRFLHLGMGGGALARLYLHVYPEIQVDGVDIDREMIRLGQRFLGLSEDPRLRIFIQDARAFLVKNPPGHYDVIVWDIFQGGVFVPYYAITREFFELARDRLAAGGVLASFIAKPRPFDSPRRREKYGRLFRAVGNTLAAVFPSVFYYPVGEIGYYVVATREPTSLETVRARLEQGGIPEVMDPLTLTFRGLREYRPDPAVPLLTDDLAPVDQLIYDAFFRE